jgi:cysteine synthase B
MESAIVPGIYDPTLADEDVRVSTEESYAMVRRLASREGLLVGVSSGSALAAAIRVGQSSPGAVVVTIFPDGGEKYLSQRFWDDEQPD